jgi:hypothetical protein
MSLAPKIVVELHEKWRISLPPELNIKANTNGCAAAASCL